MAGATTTLGTLKSGTRLFLASMTVLILSIMWMGRGEAACCLYGCCDCSCVSSQVQAKADEVARQVNAALLAAGIKGTLRSFEINSGDNATLTANPTWVCRSRSDAQICVVR